MKLATKQGHFRNGKWLLVLSHWVQTRRIGAKFSKQFSVAAGRRREVATFTASSFLICLPNQGSTKRMSGSLDSATADGTRRVPATLVAALPP